MKAEFDNEIDALLRRTARAAQGRVAHRGGRDAQASAHLDADELSAFAENALPEAARLSAASHLADCDECRGLVVTLSRAAGDVGKRAAVDPSEAAPRASASLSGWLASLFSPRVLRFVAPALALCLVGAVGLLLLRTRREGAGNSVAQRGELNTARPNVVADGAANANANANAPTGLTTFGDAPAENANAADAPAAPEPQPAAVTAPADESPDGSEGRARDPLSSPTSEAVTVTDAAPPAPATTSTMAEAPAPAAGTSAAAPPPPAPREDSEDRKIDSTRAAEEEVARVENKEKSAQQPANTDNQQTPDGSRNKPASPAYGGGLARERTNRSLSGPRARRAEREADAARDGEDARSAGETRSAAGHRFRREGSAWVDVNYRPTMSMTGVRRGTEAFRALVADIPELGRIAEQLGGEVIAVVRGRAYRIR